jgi:purine nucleoside phosphorylase
MRRIGVMGGTGLLRLEAVPGAGEAGWSTVRADNVHVETAYGEVDLRCITLRRSSVETELVFLQRHHGEDGTTVPPHQINHRANIRAFVDAGVDVVLAVCSVGTLTERMPPGRVGVATDAIDLTGRSTTFYDDDAVFTSMAQAFHEGFAERAVSVLRSAQNLGNDENLRVTYRLTQGPQFETPAEIDAIERLGGEVVGMTMPREAKLAAEVGMPYLALCIAANWAAGRSPKGRNSPLDHEEVSAEAHRRLGPVWAVVLDLLEAEPAVL